MDFGGLGGGLKNSKWPNYHIESFKADLTVDLFTI